MVMSASSFCTLCAMYPCHARRMEGQKAAATHRLAHEELSDGVRFLCFRCFVAGAAAATAAVVVASPADLPAASCSPLAVPATTGRGAAASVASKPAAAPPDCGGPLGAATARKSLAGGLAGRAL